MITLDELIEKLESIKEEHGGEIIAFTNSEHGHDIQMNLDMVGAGYPCAMLDEDCEENLPFGVKDSDIVLHIGGY